MIISSNDSAFDVTSSNLFIFHTSLHRPILPVPFYSFTKHRQAASSPVLHPQTLLCNSLPKPRDVEMMVGVAE